MKDFKTMQNFKLGLLELVRSGSTSAVMKGCWQKFKDKIASGIKWCKEPRVRVPRGYYHKGEFMRFMYKFSYSKGCWLLDAILCLINVSLLTSDQVARHQDPTMSSLKILSSICNKCYQLHLRWLHSRPNLLKRMVAKSIRLDRLVKLHHLPYDFGSLDDLILS